MYYFKYHNAPECNEDHYKDVKEYKKAKNQLAYEKIDQMFPSQYQNGMQIISYDEISILCRSLLSGFYLFNDKRGMHLNVVYYRSTMQKNAS